MALVCAMTAMQATTATSQIKTPDWISTKRGRLHLLGHGLLYVGAIAVAVLRNESFRNLSYAGAWLLALTSLMAVESLGIPRVRNLVLPLMVMVIACGVHGQMRGNWRSYFLYDTTVFPMLFAALVGAQRGALDGVLNVYEKLLPWGVLAALTVLVFIRPASIGERIVTDLTINAFILGDLCLPAVVLALLRPEVRGRSAFAVFSAHLVLIVFGVFTASRGAVLLPVGSLAVWTLRRPDGHRGVRLLFFALLALPVVWVLRQTLAHSESVENLVGRFGADDFTTGRDDESEAFLERFAADTLWGRGLGGSYFGILQGNDQYGSMMVHYGHLHLVLKGGYVLLACVLLPTLVSGLRGLLLQSPRARSAVAAIVLFVINNYAHTQFMASAMLPLFAISMGALLGHEFESASVDEALPQRRIVPAVPAI